MSSALPYRPGMTDPVGRQFDRLFVLAELGAIRRRGHADRQFLCVCDCARQTIVSLSGLRTRHSRSCGCLQREHAAETGRSKRRHGMSKHATYRLWQGMLNRCRNPEVDAFENYGGRGISVCDRWLIFEHFLADIGPRPSSQHSLDRENNDGNYEPSNVRWATATEQARNQRSSVWIEAFGERKTRAEWAALTGISAHAIMRRINSGWDIEVALTATPRSIRHS